MTTHYSFGSAGTARNRANQHTAATPLSGVMTPASVPVMTPKPNAGQQLDAIMRDLDATTKAWAEAGYGYGTPGTWVRDTCHALPQAEVCARLSDRRSELRRRFFNAQESERNVLRREERGLNARLADDCGIR